ncbi:MAG: alpha/beta hydrolase, partial [Planctomycetota bacterium]
LPVLYMPDGGIKEDFPHIANTLAKLIAENTIPPMILVGIENTERRRDLTGPSEVAAEETIAPLTDGAL